MSRCRSDIMIWTTSHLTIGPTGYEALSQVSSFKTFGALEHHHRHECRKKQYPTSVVGGSFLILQLSASFSSCTSHHQRISQTGIGRGNQCHELLHYKDVYRVRRHELRFLQ